ncbi:MAG TPA: peptidoglycan DD-metalloendopeptidase family protein [Thermoanaerobaculia bacterium]|nr:peptidoglycan DD-metalloendopeptidase family protein [Thermoanaerobaculia bacterium]
MRRSSCLIGLVLLGGSFLLQALPLDAQPSAPSREQELAALRQEIARMQAQVEQARRRKTGLQGEMAAAELELRLQERRLAEALAARELAAQRASQSEQEVRRLETSLTAARQGLARRLTGIYRLGRQGYLRLFFLLKPDDRLLPAIRSLRYLARRDRETVLGFQEAQRRLAQERDQLVNRRGELEQWIAREQSRRNELGALRARTALLLARAEQEQSRLAARASDLADRERKLAGFLDLLQSRNTGNPAGTPMQEFRGVLDWPVPGRVTAGFGPRLDPRYRTQVPHNGLDLATTPGNEVRVVFPGKVLFAAPFQGYGTTVIVHHPGRVFSLYAGLSQLKANKDDVLSLNDVVGLASDKLYFEIRVENRPEDPTGWLR